MSVSAAPANNPAPADLPPVHPWRWIIVAAVAAVSLFLGGLAINLFTDVPLTISPETTYITEPWMRDGRVDCFVAIEQRRYPAEMRTDDNGARLIVRAIGPGPDHSPALTTRSMRNGLVPTKPTLTYEEPCLFSGRYVKEQEALGTYPRRQISFRLEWGVGQTPDRPWTLDELPMMEAWLTESGPALTWLQRRFGDQRSAFPITASSGSTRCFTSTLWMSSGCRGSCEASRREHAIGWEWETSTGRSTTPWRRPIWPAATRSAGFTWILLSVIAFEGIAHSIAMSRGVLDSPPSEEQLQRMMDELNNLPARAQFEMFIENERYGLLDWIQTVAKGGRSLRADYLADTSNSAGTRIGLPIDRSA